MKTKSQKKENIDALKQTLPGSSITIFTTFAREGEVGLSVSQLQELKRSLRASDGEYLVAKKTLVDKAMQDLNYDGIDVFAMDGSMGLVLGHGDVYTVAKALYQFAKTNPMLKLYVAWMDGQVIPHEQLMEMATLPGREELLARLLGMLQYPVRGLAIVLDQVAQKK